eukprot:scaffold99637_cov48-Phaeocystis_antarctica.AAC.1
MAGTAAGAPRAEAGGWRPDAISDELAASSSGRPRGCVASRHVGSNEPTTAAARPAPLGWPPRRCVGISSGEGAGPAACSAPTSPATLIAANAASVCRLVSAPPVRVGDGRRSDITAAEAGAVEGAAAGAAVAAAEAPRRRARTSLGCSKARPPSAASSACITCSACSSPTSCVTPPPSPSRPSSIW